MTSIERPQVRPPAPWSFPEPVDTTLRNGVPLSVFHRPGQHVASVQVVIPLPVTLEPADREGLATIVSRTMDEGTVSHSADEFAGLLEGSGIALGASQTLLGLTLQLEVATGALRPALELALECLSEPAFPDEEVDRHVAQRLSDIEHELADPGSRAALQWLDAYYDPSARASRPVAGRATTVGAVTAADCRDFHAAQVSPDAARVVVAGDLDAAEAHAVVDATLGAWSPSGRARDASVALDLPRTGGDRIVFVHRPGSVQTQVQLGWVGPSRRVDGGWAPYPVLGYLVGGSPGARIDRVLREDKGYTYGFGAGFRPRGASGTFVAGGSVRGDVTAPAVELLWEVLDGVAGGFTADEVRSGVDYVGMTAPGRYATADAVADEAAALALDGLDTGFVTDYLSDLRRLTADDLAQGWQRWGSAPRTLVLVGDAEAHADAVRALGRGVVTVV